MISATRKDGTPVGEGDRVLAIWEGGRKHFGRVSKITGGFRFSERGGVRLQTYTIRCDDGRERPAHAWHIKMALPKHARRRHKNFSRRIANDQTKT